MWQPIDIETGKPLLLASGDWPLCIHGTPKAGSSFFTIALTADLVRRGYKVLFICTHAEAIHALQVQLDLEQPEAASSEITETSIVALKEMQLVTICKRKNFDILTALRSFSDWTERIIVIKNVEEVLTPQLWTVVRPHKQLIVSGDFAKEKVDIDQKLFPSSILFSESPGHWHHQRQQLPTYLGDGLISGRHRQFIVKEEVQK